MEIFQAITLAGRPGEWTKRETGQRVTHCSGALLRLVYEIILLNKILRNYLLSENMPWIMHHSMLPLIISCTRSWNFASHLFVKLLAISETIYTVCCEEDYFPKGKFKLFDCFFHYAPCFFRKVCFLLPICLPFVICGSYARQTFASLGLFTCNWLAYIRTYCVPIATLNQNKWSRLLYLDDAQIINSILVLLCLLIE